MLIFFFYFTLENKSWPFRLVFQSLVCVMGSLLFSSLFLRTKKQGQEEPLVRLIPVVRVAAWSRDNVKCWDNLLHRRQGFQGAFFVSVVSLTICLSDATCRFPSIAAVHVLLLLSCPFICLGLNGFASTETY